MVQMDQKIRIASGLSGESDTRQVSTVLYCMGEEVEDVISSTDITTEERKTYKTVLAKLNYYFKVRTNVILEREPGSTEEANCKENQLNNTSLHSTGWLKHVNMGSLWNGLNLHMHTPH